jgi:hypothetical protein
MRPAVGEPPRRCPACGGWEYGGAPGCPRCAALVDDLVEEAWREFLAREFGAAGALDESAVAEMVAEEPDRHDWRVFDAALDRLTCGDCGDRLARGPAGCAGCERAHGFRYAAIETDRPGVPPGNEHAIRVNVSVIRRPQGISAPELLGRRLFLPVLLAGALPTTREAQRMGALFKGGATPEAVAPLIDAIAERMINR